MCKSNTTATEEYSKNMNFESFKNWFVNQLLPNLHGPHFIVFDNAPFHNQSEIPKDNAPIEEIVQFLQALGHPVDEYCYKTELRKLLKDYRNCEKSQVIDQLARIRGHVPVRLPPYHCKLQLKPLPARTCYWYLFFPGHYNPIEEVWHDMKMWVRERNTTYKIDDVIRLVNEFCSQYDKSKWQAHVRHAVR